LQATSARHRQELEAARADADVARGERDAAADERERLETELAMRSKADGSADPVHAATEVELGRLREAAISAAETSEALARTLRDAAEVQASPSEDETASAEQLTGARRNRPHGTSAPRRRPSPLPPGIFDNSAEAAEHLVRVPGAVLLVDGYNASLQAWPDRPISEQRDRLVSALAELRARCGVKPHVVFDGDEAGGAVQAAAAQPVNVVFTAAEVEADDVIIAMVESLPATTPVVVATNDRRVQDGSRSRGANVITIPQLFVVLRR
jgi:predicted RNA-binding protein with PIN domain